MYLNIRLLKQRPTVQFLHHRFIIMIGRYAAIGSNKFVLTNQNGDI